MYYNFHGIFYDMIYDDDLDIQRSAFTQTSNSILMFQIVKKPMSSKSKQISTFSVASLAYYFSVFGDIEDIKVH